MTGHGSIKTTAEPLVCLTPEKWRSGMRQALMIVNADWRQRTLSSTAGGIPQHFEPTRSLARALTFIHMRSLTFGYPGAIEAKRWVKSLPLRNNRASVRRLHARVR